MILFIAGIVVGFALGYLWMAWRVSITLPRAIERTINERPEMFRAAADEILAERQK